MRTGRRSDLRSALPGCHDVRDPEVVVRVPAAAPVGAGGVAVGGVVSVEAEEELAVGTGAGVAVGTGAGVA